MRPVRADTMIVAGTIDQAAYGMLPAVDGAGDRSHPAQTEAATKYLADNWAKAIG